MFELIKIAACSYSLVGIVTFTVYKAYFNFSLKKELKMKNVKMLKSSF